MKVPSTLLPMVSISGFHYTAMMPTSTLPSSSTSTTTTSKSPSTCVEVSVTNYLTNGSYSVNLNRDDQLECFVLRYDPRDIQFDSAFFNINMTCLDEGVHATFERSATPGATDELYVNYVAEDRSETFFELKPMLKDNWLFEDGAVYEKYYNSTGCSNGIST